MERIYLTDNERHVLRTLQNAEDGIATHLDIMCDISVHEILREKGLINYFLECYNHDENQYCLSAKGKMYLQMFPNLEKPKTEEEKKQEERKWELKMNAANWAFSLLLAVIGAILGYLLRGGCE